MASISVIIPIYKVEKVLGRCLDSLLAQTFTDWEAICVDDGSPDGCGALLDSYAARDGRIVAVHTANAGVGAARNTALARARGEFLMFVDSDDFLHPQTMELCMYFALRDSSDVVAYTYNRAFRTRLTVRHFLGLPEANSARFRHYCAERVSSRVFEDIFEVATEYTRPSDIDRRWAVKHCQPWRCMLRASKVRDIVFCPGIMYEDFLWWSEVLLRVGRTTVINLPLYYYYPNFTGYIHSASRQFRIDSLRIAIDKAVDLYDREASEHQLTLWRRNFLTPFTSKLSSKTS